MRNLIFAGMLLLVASCTPQNNEDKMAELQEYKLIVEDYKKKISALEKEIAESSDQGQTRLTPVEIIEITPREFSGFFETTGKIEAVQDAFISPEVNGQISEVAVKRGDRVTKGDLLVRLKTDVTSRNIDEVKTSLELARVLYKKQQQLWEQGIGSEIQYLEAKNGVESLEARLATLESQLAMSTVRAPFEGIVDNVMVKKGELAVPGMQLVRLVNLDDIRVTARLSEAFIGKVATGDPVSVSISSYPGLEMDRPVTRIGTVIDPSTRTFELEATLPNPGHLLKPNMLASVRVREYSNPNALVVPSIILRQDFSGTFLFLAVEKNKQWVARKTYVETGRSAQDETIVISGIREGDRVVVKGYNLVTDGQQITIHGQSQVL